MSGPTVARVDLLRAEAERRGYAARPRIADYNALDLQGGAAVVGEERPFPSGTEGFNSERARYNGDDQQCGQNRAAKAEQQRDAE